LKKITSSTHNEIYLLLKRNMLTHLKETDQIKIIKKIVEESWKFHRNNERKKEYLTYFF